METKKNWKKKANKLKFHDTVRDSFQTSSFNISAVYFSIEVKAYRD